MNLLVDDLQLQLQDRLGDIEFNSDFRISIMFELLMQDKKYTKEQKIYQALRLYYPDIEQIEDFEKAIDDILWFYRCGKELANSSKKGGNGNQNRQIYSYEFDDAYIYGAFMQQYKIDLQDIEYLHWWKFKAMFDCLSDDTKFVEIMGYRAVDLRKIKDKQERERYKKLKEAYKLPDMRSDEEKEADFANALW